MNKSLLLKVLIITSFSVTCFSAKSNDREGYGIITDNLKKCEKNDDCILVPIGCDGCCQYDALNKNNNDIYHKLLTDSCKEYSGAVCDCLSMSDLGYEEKAVCENGLCRRIEIPINK